MTENGERFLDPTRLKSSCTRITTFFFWQGVRKKRHASEQTIRTAPQPELATLSQDDLGLREKGPSSNPETSNLFFFRSLVLASGRICNSTYFAII
jgi:hypothetical protein